ncbi:MAG TPA: PhnD/SsuA/transferrin family substrate-binding protein [Acidimicrobiia bacterium]|nr:PhnD/SsuA/transferrin family substrate-binding protein [Acidimicrobiia bacterium]
MQLGASSRLSEPQNRLFDRRLTAASNELGLAVTEAAGPATADLAYLCGLPASRMLSTHYPLVAPVLPAVRYQNQPWYFVDVLARNEGMGVGAGRWAYNQTSSFSGWLAVRQGLRLHHVDPDQLEWTETGSHASSLAALRSGAIDLAGVDSMILDLEPHLADNLVVIDSWGPWPTPPVMAARSLDQTLVDDLVHAFLGSEGGVNWVALDPNHLEPIEVVGRAAAREQGPDAAGDAVLREEYGSA